MYNKVLILLLLSFFQYLSIGFGATKDNLEMTSLDTILEAENATLTDNAVIAKSYSGYSGIGYVNMNSGNVEFVTNIITDGYYDVYLRYISLSERLNDLYVDGVLAAQISFPQSSSWKLYNIASLKLKTGIHKIAIVKNWGNMQIDYMRIASNIPGPVSFNIGVSPVTPNASVQAVNLYKYLKANFGSKIILGTMANSSTNIDEANWVYNNTGKWPALTTFDFINHTNLNQKWVQYTAPYTLGQSWWNNNGIVSLMWHWRDPLTKSGSFYTYSSSQTDGTNFDVSKITDTTSNVYKAIVVDIDVIAGYLKQFKTANIPILWRPLHEAEGGWFWWGAKGAEPFKTLWKVMFDRLVSYHGLNNLIWVYTTSVSDSASLWYPGDNYVDVMGMDIYAGENQHGSQYVSFNKVRALTGGRKLISLSECGSIPDPALMTEYGDTWSWVMPWYGSYTDSTNYNGASYWQKIVSYDYVVTRDKMPNLKTTYSYASAQTVEKLNVYPNPVSDKLYIDGLNSLFSYDFKVLDIKGGEILSGIIEHERQVVLKLQEPGIYLLIVRNKDMHSDFTLKIIKN